MKKNSIVVCLAMVFAILMLQNYSMTVCAQSSLSNALYEVVDSNSDNIDFITEDMSMILSAYVVRQVIYEGTVIPPMELTWTETLNGSTYSGTLYLAEFSCVDNQTIAIYKGSLDKQ